MPNKVLYILMSLTNILLLVSLYFAHKSRVDCNKIINHQMKQLNAKL